MIDAGVSQGQSRINQTNNLKFNEMKKVLLAIAVIALIGCASCKKTRTCECKWEGVSLGTYTIQEDCSTLETEGDDYICTEI